MSTMTQGNVFARLDAGCAAVSGSARWTGRGLSAAVILFLAFDSLGKLLQLEPVVAGTAELGFPVSQVSGIGVLLLVCLVVYVIPRTAVLGAVLLTGYLGGAVAAQLRVQAPLFSHTFFPVYIAIGMWGGLYLREARLRALFPWHVRR